MVTLKQLLSVKEKHKLHSSRVFSVHTGLKLGQTSMLYNQLLRSQTLAPYDYKSRSISSTRLINITYSIHFTKERSVQSNKEKHAK